MLVRRVLQVTRAAGLASLFAGCIIFVGPGDDDDVRDLVRARARWNVNGVANYDVTARTLCFCILGGEPVRVSVRNGQVTSAIIIRTQQPVPDQMLSVYRPVERLFDLLEDAMDKDAHQLDVTYDDFYGYPKHFFIDYSENVADEEFGYEITDFDRVSG